LEKLAVEGNVISKYICDGYVVRMWPESDQLEVWFSGWVFENCYE
jgi:hypothetical protein